jgi:L-amino acid N-acyltransferase YncA
VVLIHAVKAGWSVTELQLIECTQAQQGQTIQAIFNQVILNSTALYEYEPRTEADMQRWFAGKAQGAYPVLGCVDANDQLLGFASYGPFRDKPANRLTLEHAIYVAETARGQGVGRLLLQALMQRATTQGYHTLIAAIDTENLASIQLHESEGFVHAGTLHEVASKFDRWLDLAFYQKLLKP